MGKVKEFFHERLCIEKSFQVDKTGIIQRKGRFKGEKVYLPYFWEHAVDGCATEYGNGVIGVAVDGRDRILFPELGRKRVVKMQELPGGHVREV